MLKFKIWPEKDKILKADINSVSNQNFFLNFLEERMQEFWGVVQGGGVGGGRIGDK